MVHFTLSIYEYFHTITTQIALLGLRSQKGEHLSILIILDGCEKDFEKKVKYVGCL